MESARIAKFRDVKVGDIICKRLDDVRIGHTYAVLEIGTGEDKKGNIVSLRLQPTDQTWPPHWHNSDPEDLIIIFRRPWRKGRTEADERESVMHCVRSVDRIPYGRSGVTPVSQTIDQEVRVLGVIIAEYELGKQQEAVKPEPAPENCYEGRCKHPKNFAGSCIVYLMDHPPQRDC